MESTNNDEKSIRALLDVCEHVVHDIDASTYDHDSLRRALDTLNDLKNKVREADLFSENETFDELPTSSLRFFLIPAYFAYVAENIPVERQQRPLYLKAAKKSYREYVEKLLAFEVVNFRLPWIGEDGKEVPDVETQSPAPPDAAAKRAQKIQRAETMAKLKETIDRLKIEVERNNDDSTTRDLVIAQLRMWGLKAMTELDAIDQELPLAEYMIKVMKGQETHVQAKPPVKMPPFIITKDEYQRKVYGLGYPSIPTYSVDQWCTELLAKNAALSAQAQAAGGLNVVHLGNEEGDEPATAAEAEKIKAEDDSEEARQHAIWFDEYKDEHRRGEGNTFNKG